MHVVFVCSGNICRSAMAEGIARSIGRDDVRFSSAGTMAAVGDRATVAAQRVSAEIGVDLSGHRAHPLPPDLARRADLVLVMTEQQRRTVLAEQPSLARRVELLDPSGREIPDPYGRSDDVYRATRERIAEAISVRAAEW